MVGVQRGHFEGVAPGLNERNKPTLDMSHFKNHLRSRLWKRSISDEVTNELDFHVEMRTRELVNGGMDREAARAAALARFGDLRAVNKRCRTIAKGRDRKMRWRDWLEEMGQDFVFALRLIQHSPTWALLVVLTLGIGIAANSVVFSVVDAVVLAPLPFPEPDQLVRMWETTPEGERFSTSDPNYLDFREHNEHVHRPRRRLFPVSRAHAHWRR